MSSSVRVSFLNVFCSAFQISKNSVSRYSKYSFLNGLKVESCCNYSFIKSNAFISGWRRFHTITLSRRLQQHGMQTDLEIVCPFDAAHADLEHMFEDIWKDLSSDTDLENVTKYYLDGKGKHIRPLITVLMARAVNYHMHREERVLPEQRDVAKVSEMIHSSSLLHDDVIDAADTRRGKASVNMLYGQRKAVMAGDFILAVASTVIAQIRNEDVIACLAQVVSDLIHGELMQLGSKEKENERFAHYLKKTYKKTASLIAFSCKAVAILAKSDESVLDVAYKYGRNVGMAFQLVDDILDFNASAESGKKMGIDLKTGLATAPVLFACEKFPELNPMIMRRFSEPGDVEKAFEFVHKSDGIEQTRFLAYQHCQEAVKVIRMLESSPECKVLELMTDKVLNRLK